MKKRIPIICALPLLLLTACNVSPEKEQQTLEEITKQELATALQERDELLALVKDVSAGMKEIKQLENIMSVAAAQAGENTNQKAQILSDIANLKERILQRKKQLQELEEKLKDSTINNKELQETIGALRTLTDTQVNEIETLKRHLEAANEQIVVLNDAVDSLNTTVSTVTEERDMAKEASVKLANEMNTCYYVIGDKSALKKHNIIESGFLRKTKLMKGDFDKGVFVISDKRMLNTLPLNTKKAKILTNHPASSYKLAEENGQQILRITNPGQFWSLTNYLVVQKD